MREQFADLYNMVTVQCEYFGSQFMQSTEEFTLKDGYSSLANIFLEEEIKQIKNNFADFIPLLSNKTVNFPVLAKLGESTEEFVDMGYMQAIDVITSIEAIQIILKENVLAYDENRVIGFGQSQGAYLLHLCNRLVPHLFSQIIDNAAWVSPVYLYSNRWLYKQLNNATLCIEFDYIAKNIIEDKKALSLHELYKRFKNGAYIYSCIGTTDNLVNVQDKRSSLSKLNYVKFEVIDSKKVDGIIFKSTNHGLDADFIQLVDYVFSQKSTHLNKNKKRIQYDVVSSKTKIHVDYSYGLPLFQFVD